MDLAICLSCRGQLRSCQEQRAHWLPSVLLYRIFIFAFLENEEEKNLRRISYLQATKVERMEVEEK